MGCGRPAVLDCLSQAEAKICKEGDVGDSCSSFCVQECQSFLVYCENCKACCLL